jgi:hypothetical protein
MFKESESRMVVVRDNGELLFSVSVCKEEKTS